MATRTQNRGFTTIELMITVAILGILAAVAVVSYSGYIKRARNSEATAVLANIRIKQEAYRAVFHIYSDLGGTWVPDEDLGSVKENRIVDDADWIQLGAVFSGSSTLYEVPKAGGNCPD